MSPIIATERATKSGGLAKFYQSHTSLLHCAACITSLLTYVVYGTYIKTNAELDMMIYVATGARKLYHEHSHAPHSFPSTSEPILWILTLEQRVPATPCPVNGFDATFQDLLLSQYVINIPRDDVTCPLP